MRRIELGLGFKSLSAATTAWTPSALFTGGVTGEWWEIPTSGFSGLWQDAAKTTPVTAYDQQVGLVEGKEGSYDLILEGYSTTLPYIRSGSGTPYLELTGAQTARAATDGGLATAEMTVVWAGVSDSNRRMLWCIPQSDSSWVFPFFRFGQWRADNPEATDVRWNGSHPATSVSGLTGLATTGCVMKVYAGNSIANSGVYLNGASHTTITSVDNTYSGDDFLMFGNSVNGERMTGKWYGTFVASTPILATEVDTYFMELMGLA